MGDARTRDALYAHANKAAQAPDQMEPDGD